MTQPRLLALLLGIVVLVAACGQVITPLPSRTPEPASTPSVTPESNGSYTTTSPSRSSSPDVTTPTLTPTPLVHVVQKGDTLLAIAIDFNVSVDALQRANGIENPQFLQVGEELVIPIDEASSQASPALLLPTPTPQPIRVQGVAFYETPAGSLVGLGEIANTTPLTLTNVQLEVVLLDAGGQPLVETDTFAATDILFPGARSPFSVLVGSPPKDWDSYQVTVIRGQEAGVLANAFVPMSVTELEGSPSGPQFVVTGTVRNGSADQTAKAVDVFVTTYDAQGSVTGYRRVRLSGEEDFPPTEERAFSVTLSTHGGRPNEFSVNALGHTTAGLDPGE